MAAVAEAEVGAGEEEREEEREEKCEQEAREKRDEADEEGDWEAKGLLLFILSRARRRWRLLRHRRKSQDVEGRGSQCKLQEPINCGHAFRRGACQVVQQVKREHGRWRWTEEGKGAVEKVKSSRSRGRSQS